MIVFLKRYIPSLRWLANYQKPWLRGDLFAGLTVGVMLIPQGMAYALIAGLPPIYGLYSSIIPLVVYAALGTSRQLGVGPVALISLMVGTAVSSMGTSSVEEYVAIAIFLSLMVGVLKVLLGILRLGFLTNFLSHPVVSGFTSAAAIIIGLNQVKHVLGVNIPSSKYLIELISNISAQVSATHVFSLIVGASGIALLFALKKWAAKLPGALILVVLGILASYLFQLEQLGVKVVGEVPGGFPAFRNPWISTEMLYKLLPAALTISLVSYIESMAVATAIRNKHRDYKIWPNQELLALGCANIAGSFFQSYPTTGGFSRSAVNDDSGAKTALAGVFAAVLVAISLLFLTDLFYFLPKAILGSIILVAVSRLFSWSDFVHLWHTDRRDFLMSIATFFATLFFGIEPGIGVGIILSAATVIYESAKPHIAVTGQLPGTPHYRNIQRFPQAELRDDVLVFRFDSQLYFANANFFKEKVEEMVAEKGEALRLVVLNAVSVNGMDSTGADALREILEQLSQKGIAFYIAGVIEPVMEVLEKTEIDKLLGEDKLFLHPNDAIEFFDRINSLEV